MRSVIKKHIARAAVIAAFVICMAPMVSAQHGYRITKRVTFKRGEIATTVAGTIPNTLEVHEYIVRARKGQTIMLNLRHPRRSGLWFYTMSPSNAMVDEEPALRNFTGTLEETGDYHIFVYTTKGAGKYTLEIQIATDI